MAVGGALFSGGGRAAPASKALVEVKLGHPYNLIKAKLMYSFSRYIVLLRLQIKYNFEVQVFL